MSYKFDISVEENRNKLVIDKIEGKINTFISDIGINRSDVKIFLTPYKYHKFHNPNQLKPYDDESLDDMLKDFGQALMLGVPWIPSYDVVLVHERFKLSLIKVSFSYVRVRHIVSFNATGGGYNVYYPNKNDSTYQVYGLLVEGILKRLGVDRLISKI